MYSNITYIQILSDQTKISLINIAFNIWDHWNLSGICILLLYENCVNLNYVDLVHIAFQAYYILLFYMFILLIFESLMLKL